MENTGNRHAASPEKPGLVNLACSLAKMFAGFTLISGFGWLCDLLTFTLLVEAVHLQGNVANFVSSFVGVTFVWFMALNRVFLDSGPANHRFLLVYWCYQFASILAYSELLHAVAAKLLQVPWSAIIPVSLVIAAKILITPCNLVTNFLFMKLLTRHMRESKINHV
jgi:putative flippase GtrA